MFKERGSLGFCLRPAHFLIVCTGQLGLPEQSITDRNPFSHSVGGWKSQIKMLAVLVSPEASLPGLQVAGLWRRPHTGFSLCVRPGASLFLLVLLD